MISSTWTLAPAGALRPAGSAVRTAVHLVGSPVGARLRALPVTAPRSAAGVPGSGVPAMPVIDAFGSAGCAQQSGVRTTTEYGTTTEHNGTTLGLHSSRRPSS
ncbi:hypothetical protein [Geodermatophilus sp. DSM 44513]|uniref:hypothetical protein n=1 Tax=Geodermatophilus sp. DSM 44513 TaxID=1528104 RepID=UPI001270E2FB|nr:hypothetical protein [Geodermatophilus sp. DSM 44513]WNV74689.1 hypothetical protein RTG05_17090 [Geodermatophilus sp. DSM 44513]